MRPFCLLVLVLIGGMAYDVQGQTIVNFGAYDVGAWGGSSWLPPDGRIGHSTDSSALLVWLNGGVPTPPNHTGTTKSRFDVSSTLADLNGTSRDNAISPLDALLIINHVNTTKYHRNPVLACDVNNSGSVSPIDALLIINYINSGSPESPLITNVATKIAPPGSFFDFYPYNLAYTLNTPAPGAGLYLDVTGDNLVNSSDAQTVINWLNTR